MGKMIHIFDDDKFIDPAIKLFEFVLPNQSEYFVISKENTFKYVKSVVAKAITIDQEKDFKQFISSIAGNRIVFFHALNHHKQQIALALPHSIVKVWFIWGFDLYNNWPLLKKKIYEKETAKYLNIKTSKLKYNLAFNKISLLIFKNKILNAALPNKIRQILNTNYNSSFYKAANTMDIIVPVVPTEFSLTKSITTNAVFAPFTYGCLEDLLGDNINKTVVGKENILVGNSANPTNNHIDVFIKLQKFNLGERKVFVPLSYSGSKDYIDMIIRKGKELLGKNFVPLTEFMSLADYNKILLSCGTLIFNHVRQQGVGNIIAMGYLGATLVLNEKSSVYQYYKKLGIHMSRFNELGSKKMAPLSNQQYAQNKQLFYNEYCEERVYQKIKELLNIVQAVQINKNA